MKISQKTLLAIASGAAAIKDTCPHRAFAPIKDETLAQTSAAYDYRRSRKRSPKRGRGKYDRDHHDSFDPFCDHECPYDKKSYKRGRSDCYKKKPCPCDACDYRKSHSRSCSCKHKSCSSKHRSCSSSSKKSSSSCSSSESRCDIIMAHGYKDIYASSTLDIPFSYNKIA
jgi:hypothetical protein